MMKVPKTEQLEQILDKINTELDVSRRNLMSNKNMLRHSGYQNHLRQGT